MKNSEQHNSPFQRKPYIWFILLLIYSVMGWYLLEFWGWKIVEKIAGENIYPGFLSPETIGNFLKNLSLTWLSGLFFFLVALLIPPFRSNWKEKAHIPFFIGITFVMALMGVSVYIGYTSL